MGDLVGELGRAVLDEDGPEAWPEFLPYILQSASWSSSSGAARVTATGPNDAAAATPANNGVAMADVGASLDAAESMTVQNQSLEQQQVQLQRLQLSGGGKEREVNDPWARVVTGLRLMSSAAQHTAVAGGMCVCLLCFVFVCVPRFDLCTQRRQVMRRHQRVPGIGKEFMMAAK